MATSQLFFQSGRAKDLSALLYFENFFSVYVKHIGSDVKLIFGFLTTLIVKSRNVEDLVAVNLPLAGRIVKAFGFTNCFY